MSKTNVLILACYYPPNNLTAANRIQSWTDYLPSEKYYATVITWDWERAHGVVQVKKYEGYEVHYVPRKINFFNKVVNKSLAANGIIKKPLFFIQLLLANRMPYFTNNEMLNTYFATYLASNNVDVIVSSGSPFLLHVLVAHQKNKHEFLHIADYRDPWSNNDHLYQNNFVFNILRTLDTWIERRVSKKYDYLLAASDYQRHEICSHINFPIEKSATMLNGFSGIASPENGMEPSQDYFQILFSGAFYNTQPIEDIITVINNKLADGSLADNTKIIFLGTAYIPEVAQRVRNAIVGFEKNYDITPRINHTEAMIIQQQSDLLVMPSHTGIKGIPSSKLFDYVSTGRPILLYPNDEDIIEEILVNTQLGVICNTKKEIGIAIDNIVAAKKLGNRTKPNPALLQQYSRKEQTNVLVKTIDALIK